MFKYYTPQQANKALPDVKRKFSLILSVRDQIVQMQEEMPEVYAQFLAISDQLEHHYRDVQDMEFTVERGKLWMLQTRTGKRTAQAAVKIAVDMAKEGLITKEEALQRLDPMQINQMLLPRFDDKAKKLGVKIIDEKEFLKLIHVSH